MRAAATVESSEAREIAQSREQMAYLLERTFSHVARGEGRAALANDSNATMWSYSAKLDPSPDASIVRRYYDAPDVEAWIATS